MCYSSLRAPLAALLCVLLCACLEPTLPPPEGRLNDAVMGFETPQDAARTKVWWFHGKYPASHQGMTADLEAFRQAGIGGIVFYDQVHGQPDDDTPQTMSPGWWADLYHAARETHRLGLTMEVHVSNGFVAGGRWITPELSMKRVETVDTVVVGDRCLVINLPAPHNRYNFFRDIKLLAIPEQEPCDLSPQGPSSQDPAKRMPSQETSEHHGYQGESTPIVTSSLGTDLAHRLFTRDELMSIPARPDSVVTITLDYGTPRTLRSISYLIGPEGKATTSATNVPAPPSNTFVGTGYEVLPLVGQLEWSVDGSIYNKVCDLKPLYRAHESYKRKTLSFLPVSARYFRLRLHGWYKASEGRPLRLGGIRLSGHAMINEVEYKAAYISEYIEWSMDSPHYSADDVLNPNEILDLTDSLGDDGVLRWQAPVGRWRLLRMCMVPTGGKVKHGRKGLNGLGLECDKMSATAARVQWQYYVGCILDSLEQHGMSGYLTGVAMDSHEAGAQNWTDDLLQEFNQRRGYDLTPYLPTLAGYVVGSVAQSEGVLYDLRQTLADLISERYYGTIDSLCRSHGLTLTAQATGNAQCITALPIEAKGHVAKPQGEFWLLQPDGNYDVKESSSAAHIYGLPIASAEAFTDGDLATMPSDLKHIADAAYCFGANEFVVCASAHQSVYVPAGNPAGRCYATYTRCNTWWGESREFWDYQARVSHVLRQGRPVADICLLLGSNAPMRILTHRLPHIPAGYDFDACTEDALLHRMTVRDGRILLPTGQSYSMLVLPRSGELTLDALRQVARFVHQGAQVYGPRPTGSPSARDCEHEQEYQQLVAALWDQGDWDRGHVYTSSLNEALAQAGIEPDIAGFGQAEQAYTETLEEQAYTNGSRFYYTHRRLADADIYYINNHADSLRTGRYGFRSPYHHAQWWDPLTGRRYQLPVADDGSVYLELQGRESGFVVWTDEERILPLKPVATYTQTLDREWSITFTPYPGDHPKVLQVSSLTDWTQAGDDDLRYFSGTASYATTFTFSTTGAGRGALPEQNASLGQATMSEQATLLGHTTLLRLPANPCVTVVSVNGQRAGVVWASPWQVDLTPYLREGENDLRLDVTNSWHNRALLDLSLSPSRRQIPHPEWFVNKSDTLVPAGIAGTAYLLRTPKSAD